MRRITNKTFGGAALPALLTWTIAALPRLAPVAPLPAQANAPATAKTVQQGVFTAAQAKRGESLYAANCARCHEGADVDGPSLVGDRFVDRWREDTLDSLFTFVRTRMPGDAPGTLESAAYLDVLAFLLSENEMPAGTHDLAIDGLADTLLVGRNGPQPLPANALVQAVGCLAQDAAHNWTLTHTGRLGRTRSGNQISDADVSTAVARQPGTQTVALQNLTELGPAFSAEANQHHKVLVKGAFIRGADTNRVRVLTARSVADTCAP